MYEVPVAVLGNKIDIPTAASEEELRQALGLPHCVTSARGDAKCGGRLCVVSHWGSASVRSSTPTSPPPRRWAPRRAGRPDAPGHGTVAPGPMTHRPRGHGAAAESVGDEAESEASGAAPQAELQRYAERGTLWTPRLEWLADRLSAVAMGPLLRKRRRAAGTR